MKKQITSLAVVAAVAIFTGTTVAQGRPSRQAPTRGFQEILKKIDQRLSTMEGSIKRLQVAYKSLQNKSAGRAAPLAAKKKYLAAAKKKKAIAIMKKKQAATGRVHFMKANPSQIRLKRAEAFKQQMGARGKQGFAPPQATDIRARLFAAMPKAQGKANPTDMRKKVFAAIKKQRGASQRGQEMRKRFAARKQMARKQGHRGRRMQGQRSHRQGFHSSPRQRFSQFFQRMRQASPRAKMFFQRQFGRQGMKPSAQGCPRCQGCECKKQGKAQGPQGRMEVRRSKMQGRPGMMMRRQGQSQGHPGMMKGRQSKPLGRPSMQSGFPGKMKGGPGHKSPRSFGPPARREAPHRKGKLDRNII